MTTRHRVLRDTYHDSVQLMRIASDVAESPAVTAAEAVMGTPANRDTLLNAGQLTAAQLDDIDSDDLVLVASAPDPDEADAAVAAMARKLESQTDSNDRTERYIQPKSVQRGAAGTAGPDVALISVPGEFAAKQAWHALHEGLDVCIFSDNVPLETERELKEAAADTGQLVMGPDCGTAIVGGLPLGFANVVAGGNIGLISASGTGLQAVSSRISRRGGGVSQAIGTGGRDLSSTVAGRTTRSALSALDADDETDVIVLISKPPAENAIDAINDTLAECSTPVIAHFQGVSTEYDQLQMADSLRATADDALSVVGADAGPVDTAIDEEAFKQAVAALPDERRWLRGLFTGGTLCTEAALALDTVVSRVHSNVGVGQAIADPETLTQHAIVDLGADEFTAGRPHPMIDPALRNQYLERAVSDPTVGVVLLDVVLGHGAHEDPAGEVASVLTHTEAEPVVVASVCGTDEDPQRRQAQIETLEAAGVFVADSNVAAAHYVTRAAAKIGTETIQEDSL